MAQSWSKILSLASVVDSIKRQGIRKSLQAVLQLLRIRLWQAFFATRFGRALDVLLSTRVVKSPILYAFYDLEKAAPDFGIVTFLILAEMERRKNGYDGIHAVFVPPNLQQLERYSARYTPLGTLDFHTRLQNVLIPCCYLLPYCKAITVCASRDEAQRLVDSAGASVFPRRYNTRSPVAIVRTKHIREAVERGEKTPSLHVPETVIEIAKNWLHTVAEGKKVITITLRESTHVKDRNSNLQSWTLFADRLQREGVYTPVFIRDTEQAFQQKLSSSSQSFIVCKEASLNLLFRAALYELSYINMFVNNGPAQLCIFDRATSYIMFKVVTPTFAKTTQEFIRNEVGINKDQQFPGSTPWQKWVWEDDRLEVIEREFKAMCDIIEKSRKVMSNGMS